MNGTWIHFELIESNPPAPFVSLVSIQGYSVNLSQYRSRYNLVVYFPVALETGLRAIPSFTARLNDYWAESAKVLVIFPDQGDQTTILAKAGDFPFPLLVDKANSARQSYLNLLPDGINTGSVLFILDRYGSPYAALVGEDPDTDNLQDQILEWLEFIELQCPE